MEKDVMDFLNYIDKETEITINFLSIEIRGISEYEDTRDTNTLSILTCVTYEASIRFDDYKLYLNLEYYYTETSSGINFIELLMPYSGTYFLIAAKVLLQIDRIAPKIDVFITPW